MKQKSWISIVFSFASQCRGKIALSVLCAIISVVAGLIPYWSVYQIITLFIGGSPVMAEVWKWCWIGLGAYAIRFLLYGISTSLSHISAYTILENIRLTLAQRLMKAPLGTVIGESVGKLKSVLVDRVETIELPLAHMIPECISNLLLPVAVFVYLVCMRSSKRTTPMPVPIPFPVGNRKGQSRKNMLPPKPVRIPLRQRLLHLRVQARQRAKQLREPRTSQKE